MKFCVACENMMYMKFPQETSEATSSTQENTNDVVLYCRNCGYEESNQEFDPCFYRLSLLKDKLYYKTIINRYTPFDPTLPRSKDIPCPNLECETHRTSGTRPEQDVVYLKYNKKEMKFIYLCCNCLTAWKCPGYEQKEILFNL